MFDVLTRLLSTTLIMATPMLVAAMGTLFIERSGIINIGNEGKCVISVVPEMAEEVLKALRATPEGKDAAIIGRAVEGPSRVVLKTEIGGKRILEPPSGDPVPRIC